MPGLMQNAPKAALNHDLQWLSYANNVYLCNNNAEINLKLQHPSLVCELLKISFFKSSPPLLGEKIVFKCPTQFCCKQTVTLYKLTKF